MTIVELSKVLRDLDALVAALYEREPVGGPLHVATDDGNLGDSVVIYCGQNLDGGVVVETLCREILRLLSLLTHPQRVAWWYSARLKTAGQDPDMVAYRVRDARVVEGEGGDFDCKLVTREGDVLWDSSTLNNLTKETT